MESVKAKRFERTLQWLLTIVRIVIGWHFLYEGIAKIIATDWSSAPYLAASKWIFAPLFQQMADSASVIAVIDFLNIWGMILVGLGLMFGLFTRWASAGGALMLLFYFVAYPPFPGYMFGVVTKPSEITNKISIPIRPPHFPVSEYQKSNKDGKALGRKRFHLGHLQFSLDSFIHLKGSVPNLGFFSIPVSPTILIHTVLFLVFGVSWTR